ncbi:glycosyltransferase family 4 protein [Candidatus Kuenenia sp.]|uniref:glycosyltransferase family 4 protein n=1 Tax=Candidatus Kuenenia sp. TaxID=2499824 RepID=UPI00321FE3D7
MKIALVVYQFIKEKGGVERYVCNLAEQLVSKKYEVHIFTHCLPEKEDNRYIFHYVPAISFWSPLKYWTFAFNAPRAVKKTGIRFDIVHGFTQTLYQDIYRVGGGCHWDYMLHTYPSMQTVFGRVLLCLNPRHMSLLLLEKMIFKGKRYKQVTCISEMCKEELVSHYKIPPEDIAIIYNGVDTTLFSPDNSRKYRDSIRSMYGVSPDDILLVFVGSGFKRKGLIHVIHALAMADMPKNVKLLVVGRGDEEKFRAIAKGKGIYERVIFAGTSKEIHKIYAAGDIFVFPSEYDAFGTACLEAMASGLPVIVSKASGASEIIDDGKDGIVIEHPIHAKEIADALQMLYDKENRKQMGLAARNISEKYSLEVNINKTLSVYRGLVCDSNF